MADNIKETKEKTSFVKDVLKSIKDFDKYEDFALESFGRTLIYILKIVAILVLAITCVSIYQFSKVLNSAVTYFEENIENITYDNGTLSINDNEKLVINEFEEYFGDITIDTADLSSEQIEEYREKVKSANNEVIILKDRMIFKSSKIAIVTETNYTDLLNGYNIEKMDKQEILTYFYKNKTQMYFAISVIFYIYMFVVYLASVIVDTLLLAVVAYILARIMRMKIRFKALFQISIHALTLSILLNLIYIIINGITGFKVQYFQTMYTAISYVYIITVLFIIRADLIKKQMELEKIKSEQEKIHEELEMKKQKEDEENQDRKNKEEKQKQREKERSEEKDDSSNVGNKPEGSNA